MKSLFKNILIVFLILLLISGVFALLQSSSEKIEEISLSQLANKIQDSQIKEITVKGEILEILLLNDEKEKSKKEMNISLSESLLNLGVDKEKLSNVNLVVSGESGLAFFLLNALPFLIPIIVILFIFWMMFQGAQKGAMQAFSFGKTKAKLANHPTVNGKKITFKDVAGLQEVKEEIQEVIEFLKNPGKFEKIGARVPRGILLTGPPGTGKTLIAKAVANEAGVPFHFVSGSEFIELFVGVGANRVHETFELAKKNCPSVLFIDELDAIGRHRGAGLGGGHDEREQTLNQILVEMDGFETNDKIIVLAGTNRPDILDPALLRPGRFDRKIILDLPFINDRIEILKIHALEKPLAENVDLKVISERIPGFSGADIANLVNEAAILAARANQKEITQNDFIEAIEKVMLGPERKSHALSKKEKKITAYHEAGHALTAISLPHTDPVHKVTIISRGRVGGYTLKLPSEDKHLKTKSEFESELAVLLGGYTAEKLVFKELTTGAANDLKTVSELARRMVTQFGMSPKLGPVTFGEKDELVFLGKDIATEKNYSENIAFEIDKEVKSFIDKALKNATTVLKSKIETLHKIAKTLIEKETLEQKELYALIGTAV